jgi:hypothetical protein
MEEPLFRRCIMWRVEHWMPMPEAPTSEKAESAPSASDNTGMNAIAVVMRRYEGYFGNEPLVSMLADLRELLQQHHT